jgi:hypothetical protein
MSLTTIRKLCLPLVVFIILLVTLACGGKIYVVESLRAQRDIVVDGKADEWQGALSFLEDEELFVGFMNDQNNLYVCLRAGSERSPARLMRQGLTVWFDPAGGKNKALGINYPLEGPIGGRNRQGMMARPDEAQERKPRDLPAELEILRSESKSPETKTLDQAKKEGLEVKANITEGSFVYELKIPLVISEGQPVGIGVQPNGVVGVLFETGKLDQSRMQGRPPGGMGGGRGGARMMRNMPEPIKIWTRVRLVQAEKATPSLLLTF